MASSDRSPMTSLDAEKDSKPIINITNKMITNMRIGAYLKHIDFVPDWIDCIPWDDLALVLGAIDGDSPQLNLYYRTRLKGRLAHVLPGDQLSKRNIAQLN